MPVIEHSITINRPVGEVFRFVADFRNDPQWQADVQKIFQTETPTRVGVMLTETRSTRVLNWRLDLNVDVVEFQMNKAIHLKGVLGQFPVQATYIFESARCATQLKQTFDIRMGFLFSLFSPLMTGVMRRRTTTTLEKLKGLLESRAES